MACYSSEPFFHTVSLRSQTSESESHQNSTQNIIPICYGMPKWCQIMDGCQHPKFGIQFGTYLAPFIDLKKFVPNWVPTLNI